MGRDREGGSGGECVAVAVLSPRRLKLSDLETLKGDLASQGGSGPHTRQRDPPYLLPPPLPRLAQQGFACKVVVVGGAALQTPLATNSSTLQRGPVALEPFSWLLLLTRVPRRMLGKVPVCSQLSAAE